LFLLFFHKAPPATPEEVEIYLRSLYSPEADARRAATFAAIPDVEGCVGATASFNTFRARLYLTRVCMMYQQHDFAANLSAWADVPQDFRGLQLEAETIHDGFVSSNMYQNSSAIVRETVVLAQLWRERMLLQQLAADCAAHEDDDCESAAVSVGLERERLFNETLHRGRLYDSWLCYGEHAKATDTWCQERMWNEAALLVRSGNATGATIRAVIDRLGPNATNPENLTMADVQARIDVLQAAHSACGFKLSCRRKALNDIGDLLEFRDGIVASSTWLADESSRVLFALSTCWKDCSLLVWQILAPKRVALGLLDSQVQAAVVLRAAVCTDDACRNAFNATMTGLIWDQSRYLIYMALASDFPAIDRSISLPGIVAASVSILILLVVLALGIAWRVAFNSFVWPTLLGVAVTSSVLQLVLWVAMFQLPPVQLAVDFTKQNLPFYTRVQSMSTALLLAYELLILAFLWVRLVHVDLVPSKLGAKTPWVIGSVFAAVGLAALGSYLYFCIKFKTSQFNSIVQYVEFFDYAIVYAKEPYVLVIPIVLAVMGVMAASVLLAYVIIVRVKFPLSEDMSDEDRLKITSVRVNMVLAAVIWAAYMIRLVLTIMDLPVFDFYSMGIANLLNIACLFLLSASFAGLVLTSWVVSHRLRTTHQKRDKSMRMSLLRSDSSLEESVPMQYSSELL
jgi:hypothetical protein